MDCVLSRYISRVRSWSCVPLTVKLAHGPIRGAKTALAGSDLIRNRNRNVMQSHSLSILMVFHESLHCETSILVRTLSKDIASKSKVHCIFNG